MSDGITAVTTLISVSLGFASSQLAEWLKDRRAYEREQASRLSTRRDKQLERRNDFQRQTLLDLQEAVQKIIRNAAKMHHLDIMAQRGGQAWHTTRFPDGVNNGSRLDNVQATKLVVRVRDGNIRSLAERFKTECTAVLFADSEQDGEAKLAKAAASFQLLNDLIGQTLRQMDEIE
jgi:hypothetical protein